MSQVCRIHWDGEIIEAKVLDTVEIFGEVFGLTATQTAFTVTHLDTGFRVSHLDVTSITPRYLLKEWKQETRRLIGLYGEPKLKEAIAKVKNEVMP